MGPPRRSILVSIVGIALIVAGCGPRTTASVPSADLKISCEVRAGLDRVTAAARLFDRTKPPPASNEALQLGSDDSLHLKVNRDLGPSEVKLQRFEWNVDTRGSDVSTAYGYEVAVAAGGRVELGLARDDAPIAWSPITLPIPPFLTLEGADRLVWPKGAGLQGEKTEILLACGDPPGETPQTGRSTATDAAPTVFRYAIQETWSGAPVETLIAEAKPDPGSAGTKISECRDILVVATRSATVEVDALGVGEASCYVQTTRSLRLPKRESKEWKP